MDAPIHTRLDDRLAEFEQAYATREREDLLLAALLTCGSAKPLPEWLFEALARLLVARDKERHKQSPDWLRWTLARALRDSGLTWQQTWDEASRMLTLGGRPAKPETVKKAYERIERSLPSNQRRPRTYRRFK